MKRKVIAMIILTIGIGFVLYPIIGNIINVMHQNSIQDEYNAMVYNLSNDTKSSIKSNANEYNQKLANGELSIISTDEDAIDRNYDDGSGYAQNLNVGSDIIALIKIPKVDIELPIFRGTSAEVLSLGIGHLRNTSLPVGGENSHCVLTGHTGLPNAMMFTDINKLQEGDMFYIQYLDEIHAYKVDQIKIVEPNNDSDLKIVPGKDYITLLTCYPYGINSHVEGANSWAIGVQSHAEGAGTIALGMQSHAEGTDSMASGVGTHAEGMGGTFTLNSVQYTSEAKGVADHVEGY